MTKQVHIDYETFSRVDLKRAGLWAYARDPSTRILCVAWAWGDAEPEAWWPGLPPPASLLRAFRDTAVELHAFNANFEHAITKHVTRRLGWTVPAVGRWVDTQAIARMCAFPDSLQRCAEALKVPLQKDKDGGRLINLFSKPQSNGTVVLPKDRPDDFKRMVAYCRQDVRVDRLVGKALPVQDLPPMERKVWALDSVINERGVRIDVAMAKGAVAMKGVARDRACARLPKMTDDMVRTVGQSVKIKAFAAKLGFPLPDLKKETLEPLLSDGSGIPDKLRDVLELRAETNLTSVSKYDAMLRAVEADDRIRGVHAYHTATTGRWGGRIVQFQNLPRPSVKLDAMDHELIRKADADTLELLYGNIMPVLRDALRNTVRASPGRMLFVVDKSAIEARVLGYLSDCQGYLKAYREKLDLYKVTAAVIFNKPYDKITDDERWLGKTVVLGLGYSMGEETFWKNCLRNGRNLPRALTKRSVDVYRQHYQEIPHYWRTVETGAIKVLRGTVVRAILPHGLSIEMQGKHLTIKLPSGRRLWYPFAYIKQEQNRWGKVKDTIRFWTSVKKQWVPYGSTYGGRLVENIVQAYARDLLANALLACEAKGLDPVMHVHDEVVCDAKAGRSIDDIHTIFRTAPPWAPGLLLGSGGFESLFYKK